MNLQKLINKLEFIIRQADPSLSSAEEAFDIINTMNSLIEEQKERIQQLTEKDEE